MSLFNVETLKDKLESLDRYNATYFRIPGADTLINALNETGFNCGEIILVPFYITDKRTYEIYDYELNITVSNKINVDSIILHKMGKTQIEEVDKEILSKLRNLMFVIKKGDISKFEKSIQKYFEFIKDNTDFQARIPGEMGEFSNSNLYFEIY